MASRTKPLLRILGIALGLVLVVGVLNTVTWFAFGQSAAAGAVAAVAADYKRSILWEADTVDVFTDWYDHETGASVEQSRGVQRATRRSVSRALQRAGVPAAVRFGSVQEGEGASGPCLSITIYPDPRPFKVAASAFDGHCESLSTFHEINATWIFGWRPDPLTSGTGFVD